MLTGTVSDFICICADIGPSYVQGVTLAAILKEIFAGVQKQEKNLFSMSVAWTFCMRLSLKAAGAKKGSWW